MWISRQFLNQWGISPLLSLLTYMVMLQTKCGKILLTDYRLLLMKLAFDFSVVVRLWYLYPFSAKEKPCER